MDTLELSNSDSDYWADDPAGTPFYYDLGIDEIILDVNTNGFYDPGVDTVLYNGSTPGVDTEQDDTLNPLIDEDLGDPGKICIKIFWLRSSLLS